MKFEELPIIPTTRIFAAAGASSTMGNRILDELEEKGLVRPKRSPSGRREVTPEHGEILYNAITGQ